MKQPTEIDLLSEMSDQLRTFKNDVSADLTARFKVHELECSRQIGQRTARGPMGERFGGESMAGITATSGTELLATNDAFRTWITQPRSSRSNFVCEIPMPAPHERRAWAPVLNAGGQSYMPGIQGPQQPALRLSALLPHVELTTIGGGAAVQWTKESTFTPNAQNVAEGALKPTSDLQFTNQITAFQTVATYTKSSVQSLQDVPGLMAWVDQRLSYSVELRLEDYLLNDPVSGLIVNAGALLPEFTPPAASSVLDVVGSALGQLSSAGYRPDGIVLSGSDVNAARLLKTTYGEYVWSSPDSALGVQAMWATPVIISPHIAPGSYLVGAFRQSCLLFDRQTLVVDISYENEDDFVRNLCTIRAELRSALAIPVPKGLIGGSLTIAAAAAAKR